MILILPDSGMKRAKNFRDYFEDIKPVTDEELEELLNEPRKFGERGRERRKNRKRIKKAKKELYRDF